MLIGESIGLVVAGVSNNSNNRENMQNKAYEDRHNESRMSDERVFRYLEVIHTKQYERFVDIWRTIGRTHIRENKRKKGFIDFGCVCSANTLTQCIGRRKVKGWSIESEVEFMKAQGLLELERSVDNPSWYTRLELTDKGKRFLDVYYSMLEMVSFFDKLSGKY